MSDNHGCAVDDPSNNQTARDHSARDHITNDHSAADAHHRATNRIDFADSNQHHGPANDAGRNDDNSNDNNSGNNSNDNDESRHDHQQRLTHHRVADD